MLSAPSEEYFKIVNPACCMTESTFLCLALVSYFMCASKRYRSSQPCECEDSYGETRVACYAWQLLEAPKTAEEAASEDGIALAL